MAFDVKDWKNLPDRTTPITAEALEDMEERLSAYTDGVASGALSVFDAKGDLLVANADNEADRLPVGADGQALVADSGEALGVKWDDVAPVAPLALSRTNGTDTIISGKRTADSNPRWKIDSDGKVSWDFTADGAFDVTLAATAANVLRTNVQMYVDSHVVAAGSVYAVNGAAQQTLIGYAGPANEAGMKLGSAGDTAAYRFNTGHLRLGASNQLSQIAALATSQAYGTTVSGDTYYRFRFDHAGLLSWGAGSTDVDTTFGRESANMLATGSGDSLRVSGELYLGAGSAHYIYQSAGMIQLIAKSQIERNSATGQLTLGNTSGQPGIDFGTGGDLAIRKVGAGALAIRGSSATNSYLQFDSNADALLGYIGIDAGNFRLHPVGKNMQFYTAAGNVGMTLESGGLLMSEGGNGDLKFGTSTGSKIGTSTSQKIGHWNKTPVVQPAAVADAAGGAIIDAEARTAINTLLARLRQPGFIAT